MSHNKFDQFNDLVTRLAAADGTLADERSHAILDTELAREVLEAIVGGQMSRYQNPYEGGLSEGNDLEDLVYYGGEDGMGYGPTDTDWLFPW
jgi:hypothetical protein